MRTIDIDNRRYRRQAAAVAVYVAGGAANAGFRTTTLDICTAGSALCFPAGCAAPDVGETLRLEIPLVSTGVFRTEGVVRHARAVGPGSEPCAGGTRVGLQFRDALLISQLPKTQ